MKQLTRSTTDSWLGGVCGGVGRYLNVDPNLIRLAVVVLTVLGFGTMILAYIVAWIIMPRDTAVFTPPATPPTPQQH